MTEAEAVLAARIDLLVKLLFALVVCAPAVWGFVLYLRRADPMASILAFASHWALFSAIFVFVSTVPAAAVSHSNVHRLENALVALLVFPTLAFAIGVLWAVTVRRRDFADDLPPTRVEDPPDGVATRLQRLDTLLASGTISEEEYRAQRERLIREL